MKRLLLVIFVLLGLALDAEILTQQSFEAQGTDTWAYTANPADMSRVVWWGRNDQPLGGASPQSGSWYWSSWNLQNTECNITFPAVSLPFGFIHSLSFFYFTNGLIAPSEYSRYCVEYDNGTEWTNWITLSPDTDAWTQVILDIPAYATTLRLKVIAINTGTSKYVHWDNFVVSNSPAPPTAPLIYNTSVSQRTDGSGLVDVYYDLFDANGDASTVSILLSEDGGSTFSLTPALANLSGDLGSNITYGTGKHIVWNAGAEFTHYDANQYQIRINAEDGTTLGILENVHFTPPEGTYASQATVSIGCSSPNVEIRFTTDGSEPTMNSLLYQTPILLSTSTTVKARAFKAQWTPSVIAVASYSIVQNNYVFVSGGTFNNTASSVAVSSFYIDKYEMTQSGYQSIMGSNPSYFTSVPAGPVEQVTWFNAIEYCNKRSIQESLTPCYTYSSYGTNPDNWPIGWNSTHNNHTYVSCNWASNGYRLPTEAEWQFAARGGNSTHNYPYSGSNMISNVAWYDDNSSNTTHTVGTKTANELGLYDMSGNVWEWVWDIYGAYSIYPQYNPTGVSDGTGRILRGGSWCDDGSNAVVSYRAIFGAANGDNRMGFRLVRPIPWVATTTMTPPGGSYSISQTVTISCATEGSSIYYTMNGSEPTESTNLYIAPIIISGNTALKVKAFKMGMGPSATATEIYTGFRFAYVPGGTFMMGDTRGGGYSNELPTHSVTLNSFIMSRFEVTQAEYQAVMDSNPAMGYGVGTDYPLYYVSWYSAIKYCNLRSFTEDLTPVYSINGSTDPATWGEVPISSNATWDAAICNLSANGYRLPTEAEWEYAARGGTNTPDYLFSGSDDINAVAWYEGNDTSGGYPSGTKPIALKAPNTFGLYDVSGNVWEWCWDWYDGSYYSSSLGSNPMGPISGFNRVVRGGVWHTGRRLTYRGSSSPFDNSNFWGLRICRTVE